MRLLDYRRRARGRRSSKVWDLCMEIGVMEGCTELCTGNVRADR